MEVKSELVDAQFEMVIDEAALAVLPVKISKVVFVLSSEITYVGTTAGWVRLGGGGFLGQVVSSDLKPSQFISEAGPTWILADGRDITGSDLHTLTTRSTAPDHRALVLRGINEDEDNLGTPRVDGLADPDGQKAVGSSHSNKTAVNSLVVNGGSHTHSVTYATAGGGGNALPRVTDFQNAVTDSRNTNADGGHTHAVSGDNETVSNHGSVYFYIKINR